VLILEKIVIGF